jgi:hypothetical protein
MQKPIKKPPDRRHPKRQANPDATCPRHPDKEWRPIVKAAWEAGWWCVQRRKYIYCYALNGEDIVKVPMSPSDWRTIRNKKADFRHAGLDL